MSFLLPLIRLVVNSDGKVGQEVAEILSKAMDLVLVALPRLIVSLFVFLAFWLGAIFLQSMVRRFAARKEISEDFLKLVGKAVKSGMLIIGAITALGILGINVSALVAGLGLIGFALGFALRDTLSNLIAGVLIFFYRPFQINDRISVAGSEGDVVEINLRYTTIQSENKRVLIPNATLYKNSITVFDSDQS